MGGVLPEQPDTSRFKRILDIGCGTGDWLIEAAKAYPALTKLYGIDNSSDLVNYARSQAEERGVQNGHMEADPRLEFMVMDARRGLEFPTHSFDLVNIRYAESWIRTSDWPHMLPELLRVSKPGGVIRLTEGNFVQTSSPSFDRLNRLLVQSYHRAGHYFAADINGITNHLPELLKQHGVQNVQTRIHTFESRGDTPAGRELADDMRLGYRTVEPFIRQWADVPDDYEDIYERMVLEMRSPETVTVWRVLTAWGTTP
jgi:ubiquinone/menaquinone biosynthesis C-methylase UbiE